MSKHKKEKVDISTLANPTFSFYGVSKQHKENRKRWAKEVRGYQELCIKCKLECKVLTGFNSTFECRMFEGKNE
jgi:hypothetical protein